MRRHEYKDLTTRQVSIIIGSVLGDGYINENPYGSSYWEVKQKASRKLYTNWLYEEFKQFCNRPPSFRSDTNQWRFITKTTRTFTPWRSVFYASGIKRIPEQILQDNLTPLSIAIWYMDDGYLDYRPKYHFSIEIATNAFDAKEHMIISDVLRKKFSINTTVYWSKSRDQRYPALYIKRESRERFIEIVRPFIIPCFSEKLPPN